MDAPPHPAGAPPPAIALPDELDQANADLVAEQISAAFAPGVTVVIADMTGTKRCDSWGARALTLAHRRAAAGGAELWLAVPSPVLRHMLAVLGIMLPVYPSLSAALARAATERPEIAGVPGTGTQDHPPAGDDAPGGA